MKNSANYDRENRPPSHGSTTPTLPNSNKRLLALLLVLSLLLSHLSGCYSIFAFLPTNDPSESHSTIHDRFTSQAITRSTTIVTEPDPTPTQAPEESLFDKEKRYLAEYNIGLAGKDSDSLMTNDELQELVIQTYEALVGEIDISQSNPGYPGSDINKKLLRIELYHSDYYKFESDFETKTADYSYAMLFLFQIFQKILNSQGWDKGDNLYADEIFDILQIGTAFVDWTADKTERPSLDMRQLLGKDAAEIKAKPLEKIGLAIMMVNAVEFILGFEMQTERDNKPTDIDDLFAWKGVYLLRRVGNQESEEGEFNPSEKILKRDAFEAGYNYTIHLMVRNELHEADCPYGAMVSALAALVDISKKFDFPAVDELTVLNEKPYSWYVSQYETGEHGSNNCMLASLEMAFRYQNLADFPSAEMMREQYFFDGKGWTVAVAIEAMEEYGLDFTIGDITEFSHDELFAEFLKLLDEGNIIFVMYVRDPMDNKGHAAIIKGYYKYGDVTKFIMSNPSFSIYGPYAYLEILDDPDEIIEASKRVNPASFFVIPPGSYDQGDGSPNVIWRRHF